jgi:hypothetical protein
MDKKQTKITKKPTNTLNETKFLKVITMGNHLSSWPIDRSLKKNSAVDPDVDPEMDPDPHLFGCHGSGYVSDMLIQLRLQEHPN